MLEHELKALTIATGIKEHELKLLKRDVAKVEKELARRKKYLKDQEDIINNAIEEGNLTLKSINYQVQAIEDQKKNANLELYQLNKDISLLQDDLADLDAHYEQMQDTYEANIAKLMKTEAQLQEKIAAKSV